MSINDVVSDKILDDESGGQVEIITTKGGMITYRLLNNVRYGPIVFASPQATKEELQVLNAQASVGSKFYVKPTCGGVLFDKVAQNALELRKPQLITTDDIKELQQTLRDSENADWSKADVSQFGTSTLTINNTTELRKTSKGTTVFKRVKANDGEHFREETVAIFANKTLNLEIVDNTSIVSESETEYLENERTILNYYNPSSCEFVGFNPHETVELKDGVLYVKEGVLYLDLVDLIPFASKVKSIVFPKSFCMLENRFGENLVPLILLKSVDFSACEQPVSLRDNVFKNCVSLRDVNLGTHVHSIGSYAFDGCASLEETVGLEGIQSFGINSMSLFHLRNVQLNEMYYYYDAFIDSTLETLKVVEGNKRLSFKQDTNLGDSIKSLEIVSKQKDSRIYLAHNISNSLEVLKIEALTPNVTIELEGMSALREVHLLCPNTSLRRKLLKECSGIELLVIDDNTVFRFFNECAFLKSSELAKTLHIKFLDKVWEWEEFKAVTNLKRNMGPHKKELIRNYIAKVIPDSYVIIDKDLSDFEDVEETSLF